MTRIERQKRIVELVAHHDRMTVSGLSSMFNCSMMTIRRDLEYLEREGLVKKIHGGVVNARPDALQSTFYDRIKESSSEKTLIGRAAAGLVKNGDVVFFDSSTTTYAAVDNLPYDLSCTAITCGLVTAVKLATKPRINVIVIGGSVDKTTLTSVNFIATKQISLFQADLFILSTNSISYPEGIYEQSLPLIELKKCFAAQAKRTVLLADHRKFDRKSLSLSLELEDISTIITDGEAPRPVIEKIRALGVEVRVV
jgi:DeoR/GlpR family transcriptional regulator of sugar metabolism